MPPETPYITFLGGWMLAGRPLQRVLARGRWPRARLNPHDAPGRGRPLPTPAVRASVRFPRRHAPTRAPDPNAGWDA